MKSKNYLVFAMPLLIAILTVTQLSAALPSVSLVGKAFELLIATVANTRDIPKSHDCRKKLATLVARRSLKS